MNNVIDYYQWWEVDAIRGDLDTHRGQFISVFENLSGDFNKATGVRNHNAFLGREIWFVGDKKWDKRGAVGTHHYEHIRHFPDWGAVAHFFADPPGDYVGYDWLGVDNIASAKSIYDYPLIPRTLFIFGEEQRGLSEEAKSYCDDLIYIPQFGSVRSLNVGTASGIVMYEYRRQHG